MTCISLESWLLPLLLAALAFGMAIGFSLRFALDYAELAAYRRIARKTGLDVTRDG